jgi:hypothetical protein
MQSYNEPTNRPSGQGTVSKYCKIRPCKFCYHEGCSWLDKLGNVQVCPLVPNPYGYFQHRKCVVVPEKKFWRLPR